jgi:hypothetical protein
MVWESTNGLGANERFESGWLLKLTLFVTLSLLTQQFVGELSRSSLTILIMRLLFLLNVRKIMVTSDHDEIGFGVR